MDNNANEFLNKAVLVTGASSGIGRSVNKTTNKYLITIGRLLFLKLRSTSSISRTGHRYNERNV